MVERLLLREVCRDGFEFQLCLGKVRKGADVADHVPILGGGTCIKLTLA
jgi:hypothetical protein